jgi:hypothetical protein
MRLLETLSGSVDYGINRSRKTMPTSIVYKDCLNWATTTQNQPKINKNRAKSENKTTTNPYLNGKSLTFHCFRKMFLSASIDSGIGLTAGKKLCGKAIARSDDTYLTTVKLSEKFIQLKKFPHNKAISRSRGQTDGEVECSCGEAC